jgi:hypothetical protein
VLTAPKYTFSSWSLSLWQEGNETEPTELKQWAIGYGQGYFILWVKWEIAQGLAILGVHTAHMCTMYAPHA